MQKYYSILTNTGLDKTAKAIVNGTKVDITHMVYGDGNGEYVMPYPAQTALFRKMGQIPVNYVQLKSSEQNIIEVSATLPLSAGGFVVRELGLIDSTGALIAVSNIPDIDKAHLNDGAAAEAELIMDIAVTNPDTVEIKINPDALNVPWEEFNKHINNKDIHVTAEEKQAWNSHVNYDDTNLRQKVTALETGKADKAVQYQVLIPAVGWSGYAPYTQTVTVEGMTSKGMPVYSHIYTDSQSRDDYAAITSLITNDGSITVTCHEDKPVGNIKILLGVMR